MPGSECEALEERYFSPSNTGQVICHGIPDQYELQDDDIVNIDVSAFHDGMHGDLNETVFVGYVLLS